MDYLIKSGKHAKNLLSVGSREIVRGIGIGRQRKRKEMREEEEEGEEGEEEGEEGRRISKKKKRK